MIHLVRPLAQIAVDAHLLALHRLGDDHPPAGKGRQGGHEERGCDGEAVQGAHATGRSIRDPPARESGPHFTTIMSQSVNAIEVESTKFDAQQ